MPTEPSHESMKIWECKIGEVHETKLPPGSDLPMRKAVSAAYMLVTGEEPEFIFSGWGAELTEHERAVVDDSKALVERIDRAINCIEELDDRSPISAYDLRLIRKLLKEKINAD